MSHDCDDTTLDAPSSRDVLEAAPSVLSLVIAWSCSEPDRSGEASVLPPDNAVRILGRGVGDGARGRVVFAPLRPGSKVEAAPLSAKTLSRKQLEIVPRKDALNVRRIGRAETFHNGAAFESASIIAGDTIRIGTDVVLLCVRRAAREMALRYFALGAETPFGRPDQHGIVGESAACWELREQLAFGALSDTHVLIHGPSGVGKELAARAVHAMSKRATARLVARNASTLPAGIAAAELFGNRRDYPNPGTPDRPGLVGEADAGTLLLDELGELPQDLQTQLLRFLDAGEYQRIGESTPRRADVRVVGATNRHPSELRSDLFARFKVRVRLPDLNVRAEDVPLLCRHLVTQAADQAPELASRFVYDTPQGTEVRMTAALADALVRHDYNLHVRELDALLWSSMSESASSSLELTPRVRDAMAASTPPPSSGERGDLPSKEEIEEALRLEGGSRTKAAKRLRLASRYVLYRLMKAHDMLESE